METKSNLTVLPVTGALTCTCNCRCFSFWQYLFFAWLNLPSPTLSPHTSSTLQYRRRLFHVTAKKFGVNTFDCFVTQGRAVTHIPKQQTQKKWSRHKSVSSKPVTKLAFTSLTTGVHSSVYDGVTRIVQTESFGVKRRETLERIWNWFMQSH